MFGRTPSGDSFYTVQTCLRAQRSSLVDTEHFFILIAPQSDETVALSVCVYS